MDKTIGEQEEERWAAEERRAVRANDHASAAIFHERRWRALDSGCPSCGGLIRNRRCTGCGLEFE